jgi:hypothetical protein
MKTLPDVITWAERNMLLDFFATLRLDRHESGRGLAEFPKDCAELPTVELRVFAKRIYEFLADGRKDYHPFSCFFFHYPKGTINPPHTDPVSGEEHRRLIILLQAAVGGALFIDGLPVPLAARDAVYLLPDREEHAVSEILKGERIILSLGIAVSGQAPVAWHAPTEGLADWIQKMGAQGDLR